MGRSFEELVTEGASVSVDGWDFSWLAGRATEQRPSWGYLRMMSARMAVATSALDLQTGGGEVLAEVPVTPPRLVATESWPPNVEIARGNLRRSGASVVVVPDAADLPFAADSFDLVVSRHPTTTRWDEVARILAPGGTFLSQRVGAGSMVELTEAMMGPQPPGARPGAGPAGEAAQAAGLVVTDLRHEALRTVFHDVGAIVYFLRKVVWTVPDFTVDRYRRQLAVLHDQMAGGEPFVAYSQRVLIEAHRPR